MTNNYVVEIRTIDNDTWHIHYLRTKETEVRVTCDLMRPNRKFWQSRVLWSDWIECGVKYANILKECAKVIIKRYYKERQGIEKFDEFFNSFIDN